MPFYRLFYHAVWTTRRRMPFIDDSNRDAMFAAMTARVNKLNGIVHAVNAMPDHVHLVVTVPPTITLAAFIGQIKGSASFVAARQPGSDPDFGWQAEYGILSVSETHLPVVIRYVQLQQQHHADNTLNRTLEDCS